MVVRNFDSKYNFILKTMFVAFQRLFVGNVKLTSVRSTDLKVFLENIGQGTVQEQRSLDLRVACNYYRVVITENRIQFNVSLQILNIEVKSTTLVVQQRNAKILKP